MDKRILSQAECIQASDRLILEAKKVANVLQPLLVYGVPRGGVPVAYLCKRQGVGVVQDPDEADVIVDDIVDSGATRERYNKLYPITPFLALTDFLAEPKIDGQWIVFPWEHSENGGDASADDIVIRLLQYIGEDPNREGLRDTPRRVLKSWKELTVGYGQSPATILAKDFDAEKYDEIIACPFIEFFSCCEHHLLPFFGVAHVAYLPSENKPRVVGLSKMARLVECFARRLQIQEQMTIQIADAMENHLDPKGVAVIIQAKHLCMACRGVSKRESVMVTSAMRGVFRSNDGARSELLKLIELASHSNGR